jgi:hypothetical protein
MGFEQRRGRIEQPPPGLRTALAERAAVEREGRIHERSVRVI